MYIMSTWFGVFLFNEDEIKDYVLFPKDAEEIAGKVFLMDQKNQVIEEEKKLFEKYSDEKIISFRKRHRGYAEIRENDSFFDSVEINPN
ncbi:MAG: hypothetical protein V5A68_03445, partial [Candidatus Thermoplasmatota archaeon]